jgi:hypothetical protein
MTRRPYNSVSIVVVACAIFAVAPFPSWRTAKAQEDGLANELPRIQPLEPVAALGSFRLQPGFQFEAVAAEPLVTNPVSACYDADGRLFVVEMRDPYPEKNPTRRSQPSRGPRRR